uniref:Uncharacterized protein n=1 Tax=Anguilla anguilla TaxID=7936 RepID=A0A0E9W718_ANGAN
MCLYKDVIPVLISSKNGLYCRLLTSKWVLNDVAYVMKQVPVF